MKKIPTAITEAFAYEVERYGNHITYLGNRDGVDYYHFLYPEPMEIGFPEVYGYKNGSLVITTHEEAFELFALFIKD